MPAKKEKIEETISMSNEEMFKIMLDMKRQLDALQNKSKEVVSVAEEDVFEDEEEMIDIPMNKSVKVVSLYNGGLTLYTQSKGTGKPYRFNGFGSTRTIVYSDLIDCIAHQARYFTDGFVMILDKEVNKAQGFTEAVATFLTKQQIEKILDQDVPTIHRMLKNTTKNILDTVVENVTFALVNGKSLDMNKVKAVSDVYGRDINEIVSTLKEDK